MIATWARILQRVPGSGLLLHHCFSDYFDPRGAVRNRIESAFAAHGIAPGRLRFAGGLPFREHLELHGQVDIALDTFPYNGTTTTCESLWMGVPVITLEGTAARRPGGKEHSDASGIGRFVAAAQTTTSNWRSALPRIWTGWRACEPLCARPWRNRRCSMRQRSLVGSSWSIRPSRTCADR